MLNAKIDLIAPDLFGNDAAEDEDEDVFRAYAVDRDEVANFADPSRRFCVVRAYKGEGKSALLRLVATRLSAEGPEKTPVLIRGPANTLAPTVASDDFVQWTREWKKNIFDRVAVELGARIGFAWSDDAMGLVEEAEKRGFKSRSLLSSILDRLGVRVGLKTGGNEMTAEVATKKLGIANAEAALQRWVKGREAIWILVDDVDHNFQNTPQQKAKVASFFVACREIANAVPELRIRAAVRPNVWTTIKMEFEPLSHVEQYITDLTWSENANRRLLSKRVEGYLRRSGQWDKVVFELPSDQAYRDKILIAGFAQDPMTWGRGTRPPHVLLHTLSKHRPRWIVELCKEAAKGARKRGKAIIEREDIYNELGTFGQRRIQDTVAEFRSQCPEIGEIIAAFNRESEEFATDALLDVVSRKVLDHLQPKISGVLGAARAVDVAQFLFEIGFVFGKREFPDGTYEHVTYSDGPQLLRARTNIDDGLRWEVHPVFRQALEMRDATGRFVGRPEKDRKRRLT